jgi:hypothetical protein
MEKSQRFHAATIASFEAGDAEAADRIRRGAILGQIERFRDVFANGENSG